MMHKLSNRNLCGTRRLLTAAIALAVVAGPLALPGTQGSALAATTYRISGRIVCGLFGFGISGIKMNGLPGDPKTDGDGRYSAIVPEGWSGAAYPLSSGLHFDPFGKNYTNVTADIVANYKTTLPERTISGYVKTLLGEPVEGVTMAGLPKSPRTNQNGFYLAYEDGSATVVPTKTGCTFDPPTRQYSGGSSDKKSENYVAYTGPGITVSPTSGLTTTEDGGTAQFTVRLNTLPTADVIVGIVSGNTAEGTVAPASLTFTSASWSTPQTVTVTGVNDDARDGSVAYTVVTQGAASGDANYAGINAADVAVTNLDNDAPGIVVNPTSGLLTTEAGGTASSTVVLKGRPTADVTIGVSSSNPAEGTASPASLVFTPDNFSVPQTVTATGVDDEVKDGDVAYSIVTAPAQSADAGYNGLNAADVAVRNRDDEVLPVLQVTPLLPVVFPNTDIGQSSEVDAFTVTNVGGMHLTGTVTTKAPFSIVSGGTFDLTAGQSQVVRMAFAPTGTKTKLFKQSPSFTSNGGKTKRAVLGLGTVYSVEVDNLDNEVDKRFEIVSGTWQSAATFKGFWRTDYRTEAPGDGSSVAAWHFQVKYTGIYQVSAWWPSAKTWTGDCPYRVCHADGETVVRADQRRGGGKWNLLGNFEFHAGADGRIEVNNATSGVLAADAVCVRWVGPVGLAKLPPLLNILAAPGRGPAPLDVLLEAVNAPAGKTCSWDFGDGSKGKGTQAMHTYQSPGSYTVTLTVGGETAIERVVAEVAAE